MKETMFCSYCDRYFSYGFAFLAFNASAKTVMWDLQNSLSTIMIPYTVLLLIKGLISQQKKCSNGPMLMEFTGVTMFPTILMQLA